VDSDLRVWESEGSTVVGNNVWNLVWTNFLSDDFAELEFGFVRLDGSQGESTLNIEQHSEVLTRFVNTDDVHQTSRVLRVSSNFAVNLDTTFLVVNDGNSFSHGKRVFQASLEDDSKRKTLSKLVWTLTWSGNEDASNLLVKKPALRSLDSLHVLLWTSGHYVKMLKTNI